MGGGRLVARYGQVTTARSHITVSCLPESEIRPANHTGFIHPLRALAYQRMIEYLAVGLALVLVSLVVAAGFYLGVRHVETLSGIERNRERPLWAQQPVDAFNHVVGRQTSREFAERRIESEDDDE